MHQEQRYRTHELLKTKGVERALFAHPGSVTWLTGFAPPIQLGQNIFAGGPPLVWYEDGHFTLFVVDAYTADTEEFSDQSDCAVVTHLGYTFEQPLSGSYHLAISLRQTLASSSGFSGVVGIEERNVPLALSSVVLDTLSSRAAVEGIDGWLEPLRMVKTSEELDKLRGNFALADLGQATARQAVLAGKKEIDVWNAIHSAIQHAAGRRVPLGNDCVVGQRSLNFTGWPLDYEIKPNGSLIVDIGTGLHGYWSDGCATYYPDEPTPQQAAMHKTAADALELAISLIQPGMPVMEIDRQVRLLISNAGYPDYPHHTGHGIGAASHEAPRIVPYSQKVLEEGMVVMLEPGIYIPSKTGVRLEVGLLVTADGAEVLSKHNKSLP
ncbi:MAG: Xaa-Pro peptidase family protein [Anaerolineales bacterium]|nr:Xaa-Pro peptidase family protein [Anaerolineales bacterium]